MKGIVYTCAHADPKVNNERFTWLGEFIYDQKPDFVIDLGDGADMRSLNTFDKGKPEAIMAQSYQKDIESYNDSQERLRHLFKKNKVRKPKWFGLEGNHENRIKKAIAYDPRLEGPKYGISFDHLETSRWFNEYHEYKDSAPAIFNFKGMDFAHYISSGNYGTAMSGEWHAYNLIKKRLRTTIVGHSHKRQVYFRDDSKAIGLVAGCFKGGNEPWAGQANDEWWSGVVVMNDVDGGMFEPEFVSYKQIKEAYSYDPRS